MTRRSAKYGKYSMKSHGQSSRDRFSGIYLLVPGSGCSVRKPSWYNTRTVFRPFPGRDQDDETKLAPCRRPDDPEFMYEWIRRYDAVTNFGPSSITFITKDPRDPQDLHDHPCTLLRKSIRAAVKSGNCNPAWGSLVVAGDRGEPLRSSTDIYVSQGILLEHQSKLQQPPIGLLAGDDTLVLLTSSSAGRTLLEVMDEKDENGNYKYEDVVDLHGGAYIRYSQSGSQAPADTGKTTTLGQQAAFSGPRREQSVAERSRYDVEVLEQFNGTPSTLSDVAEKICDKIKPWDDIINVPTMEEQMELICRASGVPADAIVYALSDIHRDIIPADIMESVHQRTHARGHTPEATQAPEPQQRKAVGGLGDYLKKESTPPAAATASDTSNGAETALVAAAQAAPVADDPAIQEQADQAWAALKMAEERARKAKGNG